jgi:hypothetical protein
MNQEPQQNGNTDGVRSQSFFGLAQDRLDDGQFCRDFLRTMFIHVP